MDERAHRIIDAIYRTTEDPDAWQDVVDALAEGFDGSAVALGLLLPGAPIWASGMPADALRKIAEAEHQLGPEG